ncbi:Putative S-adenosylmethionine-dependent methyltransferase [Cordyceps militaris CM01]|uniref:Protein-lysine N-methyltransferase EFM4 n=1 Tax=Cordyceps militaris (strain CM01) TaxID=983644 RepID=G3JPQ2_CORMM|nr:Putative S-adenosylmethionine-dependent methyltransferase [Cordyceps militaris CM01]EGX89153.1 Putative S-adenosylmethionine-dependent methyltransferase [Cordyceps militaris CM01]
MAETPKHLEPSALGTREYWDKLYTTEIANHAANPDDIGTVWFDDSDAEDKMLAFLARLAGSPDESDSEDDAEAAEDAPTPTSATVLSKATTSFLDLGCGNGSILFALRARGWRGPLVGVDYSAHSIRLATQVASARGLSDHIRFAEWDLLQGTPLPPPQTTFDVVLDKGTFDAISLSDATDAQGRRACERYKARVLPLLAERGLFLITSCNWTEDELRGWFAGGDSVDGAALEEAGRVKYRSFSFGGVSGQTISTLCFRKISAPASSSTEQAEPVHTRMQT